MGRTGLQQMIKLVRAFCRVYATWSTSAMAAIDANTETSDTQKAQAKAALDAVNTACHALNLFYVFFEK